MEKREEMTVEGLLEPRIKVIGLWPNTAFVLGEIICLPSATQDKWANEFPHLFKRLEWWEDRKPEEMPEYVKTIGGNMVAKILIPANGERFYALFPSLGDERHTGYYKDYLPATEKEYLDQQLKLAK